MLPQLVLVGMGLVGCLVDGDQPLRPRQQQQLEVDGFVVQRKTAINELLAVAKANIDVPGKRGVAAVAIRKLGHMRAAEATDFLVDHLSFDGLADLGGISPIPVLEESLPCVYSLAEIGLPAFPRLIREVEGTDAESTHYLVAVVVRRSLGEAHALLFLRHRHETQTDETKRKRLRSTIEQLGKVKVVP
ncbi:MAG: hypothetical protein K2P78_14465 [Gemmataceae bacterium]|nr:hypothetical protein [Gemmataceae bacterium]